MAGPHAGRRPTLRRLLSPVEQLIDTAAASGIVLVAVAVLAFAWANSPWAPTYEAMLHAVAGVQLGSFALMKPLELWVNDLLMAVFFFLVGLEIKRELLIGELAGWKRASLPAIGAIGGMVAPALIYAALNAGTPYAPGWGIPMATDIAFAVGVLALLGDRVPPALKLFLLALAIVDDLGAVIVIALFYTEKMSFGMLAAALGVWLLAILYGRLKGGGPVVYLILGAVMWYCMLRSGVHATIAGVLLALAVPLARRMEPETVKRELKREVGGRFEEVEVTLDHLEGVLARAQSPLHSFEHALAPWVAFLIMPVFALFNAGVSLAAVDPATMMGGAAAGAFLGLLVGKPLGIVGLVWLAEKAGLTERAAGMGWPAMAGIGLIAGIGFTMSLFIAALAFGPSPELVQAKVGVLAASVVAAVAGLAVLRAVLPRP